MATTTSTPHDALNLLRSSIAASKLPIPTSSADATTNTDAVSIEEAQYLLFNTQHAGDDESHVSLDLKAPTRFISQRTNAPLDLISVYFCYLNKDLGVGDYITATQTLNDQRTKNGLSNATNVAFAEKLDLTSWLDGESNESEFIKRLDDNADTRRQAEGAADVARGGEDVVMGEAGRSTSKTGRREEERMREIYGSERSMGDRNSVLHGIKPTVSPPLTVSSSALTTPRTSLTSANTPKRSCAAQRHAPAAQHRPHRPQRPLSAPRNPAAASPSPSSCSRRQPRRCCASRTSNPSSSTASTNRPSRRTPD